MIEEISAVALSKMLANDEVVLIDVRETDEFLAGHIEGAISLPLSVFAQKYDRQNFAPDKKIVLQCQGGVRSLKACEIARALDEGDESANLTGGLNAWRSAGLPVVR